MIIDTTSVAIGFGIGAAIAGFVVFALISSLDGDEGKAIRKARAGKGKHNGRLFKIYEPSGHVTYEYLTKPSSKPFYHSKKTGAIIYDPSNTECEAPERCSKGLEIYNAFTKTPLIISTKETLFIARMAEKCKEKHPELTGLSNVELLTLIHTEKEDLLHDCTQYCKSADTDDSPDTTPDDLSRFVIESLEDKDAAFWSKTLNPIMDTYKERFCGGDDNE